MSISSVGQSSITIQNLVQMRAQLDDLTRQISTGQRSDTYAGIGVDRGLSVSLRSQLSNMTSYDNTIDNVSTRVSLVQTVLGRVADIGSSTKSSLHQANYSASTAGSISAQATALSSLDELLGLLNSQAGDRYLFSGNDTTQPSVESLDHILNGNGSQAGLKQLIAERNQADLGADGLGRLVISAPTATSVSVAEDAVSPFGLKLASVSSSLTGATVTGPSGTPASMSVDLGATNPSEGDTLTVRFTLPDGSSENVTLTATTNSPPGSNQFTIGANPTATAANLQTALTGAVGTLAGTSLAAASAVTAADNFFDADSGNPPQRVSGSPFTATAMTAGTAANTVIWYTGENTSGSARSTASARIDPTMTVSYGTRANEDGIRSVLQNVAVLAATSYSSSDPNAQGKSAALNQRLSANLDNPAGSQTVVNIQAELAGVQTSLSSAKERHQQTTATIGDFLQQITGVSNEDVGAQILALQTRLQASLQTTAMLYQISLVNYLK